jgi:GNAT superfamily N-acetyltransferase
MEQRMIADLKQKHYTSAKRLHQDIFSLAEDPYFIHAWKNRDRKKSIGFWEDETLVGAAICSHRKLEYIYVHQAYRGGGIGTQLLQAVLAISPNIYLVSVNDSAVHRWYVKHGFRLSQHKGDFRIYVRHSYNLR